MSGFPSRGTGRWGTYLAFLALAGISGCGSSTATVKGKVFLDGKPLKGGTVVFASADGKGAPASGPIEEDGSYTVLRAPTGKVRIAVETESMNTGNPGEARKYKPPEGMKSPYGERKTDNSARYTPIPEKYMKEETSGLEFEVKGGTNTHEIKLSSSAGGAGQ
jgi:hypothetical protein